MHTSRPFLTLLAALPLACTTSPGTSTGDTTDASTSAASTGTTGASTHAEPTGTTHAHATATTDSTGHAHTGETTHSTDASTAGTTGEPSPIDLYCACMLENCHDEYHATWGEDHEASEAMCAAAAATVPSVGMPATMGNSLECRQHYCELGEPEPGACASALGGGACVD